MKPGDHIFVRRRGYTHHGIYIGDDRVIHFAGADGLSKASATIRLASLPEFAGGGWVRVHRYGERFAHEATVERAWSRLGQNGYSVAGNNCEHFATWCVTGSETSAQVERGAVASGLGSVWSFVRLGVEHLLFRIGLVEGLSGSGIMSGLAKLGSVLGLGALGGLFLLGAVTSLPSAALFSYALRDSGFLPEEERRARRWARIMNIAGTGLALLGLLRLVGTAGVVVGYSAAGLTSGLATIGAIWGGGMLAGLLTVVLAPPIAGVAAGLLALYLDRALFAPEPYAMTV